MAPEMKFNKGPEIPFLHQHEKPKDLPQEKIQILCTEEFKKWPDRQIRIQLGALSLFKTREEILKALREQFGFLEDEGPYLSIDMNTNGRPHIQLITPRGTLIDSRSDKIVEANHVVSKKAA